MVKSKHVLGINARNLLYIGRYNRMRARKFADEKLLTKRVLVKNNVATPKLYASFYKFKDLDDFDWDSLPQDFVVKPNAGYGGEGILLVRKFKNGKGETTDQNNIDSAGLKRHIQDILDGNYSLNQVPDAAFIEERIRRSKTFKKYTWRGAPDIRVIVFNKVPVMAMLRLPTEESNGTANLHGGAIGVGIDIATGVTVHAIRYDQPIKYVPDTKIKLNGIKVPHWEEILRLSVEAQVASKLGFAGVDIILDENKGPVVIEINARPGLSIQNANRAPLLRRLKRVEDLEVTSTERGVALAKTIFSSSVSEKIKPNRTILDAVEVVKVVSSTGKRLEIKARIDTGAKSSSIDRHLAQNLGIYHSTLITKIKGVRSAHGRSKREYVSLKFSVAGKLITSNASVADRSHLKYPLLIGRRDIQGFVVKPFIPKIPKPNHS